MCNKDLFKLNLNSVTIRKCCPADQVLDQNYNCLSLPGFLDNKIKSELLLKLFQNTICHNRTCRYVKYNEVGFECEPNFREEKNIEKLLTKNGQSTDLRLNSSKGCMDMIITLQKFSVMNGPFLIGCRHNLSEKGQKRTIIDKCCPENQAIDYESHLCAIDSNENTRLLTRSFKNQPIELRYKLKSFDCRQKELSVLKDPEQILSSNIAVYRNGWKLEKESFKCLDMVSKKGLTDGLFTKTCKKKSVERKNQSDDSRLIQVNVPKCCSENEILDLRSSKCYPSKFVPFHTEVYKLTGPENNWRLSLLNVSRLEHNIFFSYFKIRSE